MKDFKRKISTLTNTQKDIKKSLVNLSKCILSDLSESTSFAECMDLMGIFLLCVGQPRFDLSGETEVGECMTYVTNDGILRLNEQTLRIRFRHAEDTNIYKMDLDMLRLRLTMHIYADHSPITGFYFYGKRSFRFAASASLTDSLMFANPFYSQALKDYAINKKLPEFPLFSRIISKNLRTMSNQTCEAFINIHRNQRLTKGAKKLRLDEYVIEEMKHEKGVIARFIEGNKEKYSKEYKKSASVMVSEDNYDFTSKSSTSKESIEMHLIFSKFKDCHSFKARNDFVKDYNDFKKVNGCMQAGPVLTVQHISALSSRKELPTKNAVSGCKDWKKYVRLWLETRIQEAADAKEEKDEQ